MEQCSAPGQPSLCKKPITKGRMKLLHLLILDGYDVNSGGLTANAIDHEWVQLLLAMFALAREV